MKVLVVAEIRLYRDGVAEALRGLPDVEHVETAATGASAVAAARRAECDVVLLDMALDGGIETATALVASRAASRVVALGVREDGPDVVACAEAGVCGYVSRDARFDDLADALRSAVRGEASCSARIAAGLLRHIAEQARRRPGPHPLPTLTRRERDVLRMLETDMSNKEIARALDLQLSTVKNHVHHVLGKLGASSRHDIPAALRRLERQPVPDRI
jgi:DNA-binding NarL/FixJ family response regulator